MSPKWKPNAAGCTRPSLPGVKQPTGNGQTVTHPTDDQRQRLADLEPQHAEVETILSRDLQAATQPRTVLTQAHFDSVSESLGYGKAPCNPVVSITPFGARFLFVRIVVMK